METLHEEGVVHVAGRVLLRLEQGIKVPEGALDIIIRRHLREPHLKKDGAKLSPDLVSERGKRAMKRGSVCVRE